MIHKSKIAPLVFAACAILAKSALGCIATVGWIADLNRSTGAHAGSGGPTGTAEMKFDWQRPFGTITVETRNVRNVRRVELRLARTPGDLRGPAIASLYDSKMGPYTGKISKVLRQADLTMPFQSRSDAYSSLPDAIMHRRIVVAVCTASDPGGEIAGVITVHRIVSYSDAPGAFHDPKLHRHAAQSSL
jgi:hypothetical protein